MISITLTLLAIYSAWGLYEGAVLHKSWWWRTFTGVVIQWGAGILCWLIREGTEFVCVPGPYYCSARNHRCWLTMLMLLACHSPFTITRCRRVFSFLFVLWIFRMRCLTSQLYPKQSYIKSNQTKSNIQHNIDYCNIFKINKNITNKVIF